MSRLNLLLSILISCLALSAKAEEVSSRIWTNYVDTVQQAIAEKWKPKGFLQSYYTMVVFEVNPDGSLRRIELDKSSGNKSFDAFALDTVKLAAPFNALPVATKPIKIKYFFDFDYKTEDFILDSGTAKAQD